MSRRIAVDALEAMDRKGLRADEAIRAASARTTLSPENRAFTWELVLGVVRRRTTIDRILATWSRVKLEKVHRRVLAAMRIAVYQLVWLDRIPESAAVYESVEIVKARFPGWTVSFVNGCLRAIARAVDLKVAGALAPEDLRRAVPIRGGRHCLFTDPVFPDPREDPAGALAARHSHPEWLVIRWLERYGEAVTEEILRAGNEPAPLWLRPSPGRLADLVRDLKRREIRHEASAEPPPGAIRLLDPPGPVEELPGYAAGWFAVQDRTAMTPVHLLDPRPGERVLDLCAAPGGKATQIAHAVGPEGSVVAVDRDEARLGLLAENLRRLQLTNVAVVVADAADPSVDLGPPFDRVLADVPCSNTGVLARRVEARHRVSPESVASLAPVQRAILAAAAARVRPGGALVYSTCALLPEENGELVRDFLDEAEEFELLEERETLPREGVCDGGYAALLRRREPAG